MNRISRPGVLAGDRDVRYVARAVDLLRRDLIAIQDQFKKDILAVQGSLGSGVAAEAPATEDFALTSEQGTWAFTATDFFYAGFGVDGNWEAVRFESTGSMTTGPGQSGPKPTNQSDFEALSYPNPYQ